MEYYVAESFKDYVYDITKAYKNDANKLVVDAKNKCNRCNGSGLAISHIENGKPIPYLNDNGICYACEGKGFLFKTIRLYTEKEKAAAVRAKERAAERKVEEKLANAEKKKQKWLEKECFTPDGVTTVYVGSNSFDVKDQLKADGWKYSPMIGWRIAATGVEKYGIENVVEISVTDLASFNLYGEGFWLSTAKTFVNQIRQSRKPQSVSDWIGTEKERIKNIPVIVKSIRGCETRFGWSNIITFLNGDNILTWFTSTEVKCAVGESYFLSATVKEHKEYKGEKQTIINRTKLTLEEI